MNLKLDKDNYSFKLEDRSSKVLIITGPRSVGKTTLAREFFESSSIDYLDLDDLVNDDLSKTFVQGSKTPLEQAMELKKYDLIEEIVRNIVSGFATLEKTTAIAFAGGAYTGYEGLSDYLSKEFITIGLIPYADNEELSIRLLVERESSREHFKKLITEGKLDMETLIQRVKNDYSKVSNYLLHNTVGRIIFIQQKKPIELVEEIINLLS